MPLWTWNCAWIFKHFSDIRDTTSLSLLQSTLCHHHPTTFVSQILRPHYWKFSEKCVNSYCARMMCTYNKMFSISSSSCIVLHMLWIVWVSLCVFVYREKNNINFCVFTLSKLYPNTYYICKVVFKKDNMPQDTVTKNLKSDSPKAAKSESN